MPKNSNLVLYADDTFVFVAAIYFTTGFAILERISETLIE